MKNINLKDESLVKNDKSGANLSLILSVIIMFVSLVLYGLCFGLNFSLEKENQGIKDEISFIEKSLGDEKFFEMFNFNMRTIDLKAKIGKQGFLPQTKNIINISKNTLLGVKFVNLEVESTESSSGYEIGMIVPDYMTLIRQIKAYKQMENLDEFVLKSVASKDGVLTVVCSFEIGVVEEKLAVND